MKRSSRFFWLVFPLIGVLVALAAGRSGWALILLDQELIHPDPWRGLKRPYILLFLLIGLMPLWWRVATIIRSKSVLAAFILSILVFAGAEFCVRHPALDELICKATRARARSEDGDWVLRSGSLLRLGVLEDRDDDPTRLITIGSSLLFNAVDYDLLQSELPYYRVCRRAMAGMFPVRMLAAQDYWSVRSNDVVVFFLSDFDLGDTELFDPGWTRLLANKRGVRDVEALLQSSDYPMPWRQRIDVRAAAGSALWRSRDQYQMIALNALGKAPRVLSPEALVEEGSQDGWRNYYRGISMEHPAWTIHLKALDQVFEMVSERGGSFMVFEGRVSPAFSSTDIDRRQLEARVAIQSLASRHGGRYIPAAEQSIVFTDTDFSDGVHMTPEAAARYTSYLSGWVHGLSSSSM